MKREHFDAIIEACRLHLDRDDFHVRISLRNSEVYTGPWAALKEQPDVITVHHREEFPVFIALTAIATIGPVL